MNRLVERRNQAWYWQGTPTWAPITATTGPVCDDCLLNVHAAGGTTMRIPRAHYRRRNVHDTAAGPVVVTTVLCDTHHQEWLHWTPGQLALSDGGAA
jgi:uncharacterized RDD family membrane protein YckC